MPIALCCTSHSPLHGLTNNPELEADVEAAFARARAFVENYDPELVILFTPDHYNGFFYRLMPPFAIGCEATAIGDYGSEAGKLNVPLDIARACAAAVLDAGLDLPVCYQMEVDHGAAQPMEKLLGGVATRPIIPFFVNSVAPPFGPISRVRELGAAVGRFLATLPKRVLLIGSGGLSHEPPVPRLLEAPAEVAARLINGTVLSPEEREARQARVLASALQFAAGAGNLRPLNPDWDNAFLDLVESTDITAIDSWSNQSIEQQGGASAQEVRTWVAAYAALEAGGGAYQTLSRYYQAIPEYIAGFAITTAIPRSAAAAAVASAQ